MFTRRFERIIEESSLPGEEVGRKIRVTIDVIKHRLFGLFLFPLEHVTKLALRAFVEQCPIAEQLCAIRRPLATAVGGNTRRGGIIIEWPLGEKHGTRLSRNNYQRGVALAK